MKGVLGLLLGGLFWLAVLSGVVLLVVRALRHPPKGPVPRCCANSALDRLNESYARGEITREQYERMKRDLAA